MKKSSSLGRSAKTIVRQIQKVRKAASKAEQSKHRFADYKYLKAVYTAYSDFDEVGLLKYLIEIAPSILLTPVRANCHPFRVIIDATCLRTDWRTRSRWARCTEYALAEKAMPEDFVRFIRAHGGIAACADLASKTQPKHRRAQAKHAENDRSAVRVIPRRITQFSGQFSRINTVVR